VLTQAEFNSAIKETKVSSALEIYHGKVRDVFTLSNNKIALVASDRISAFDVILPRAIPYKGQILGKIASKNFGWVKDIVPIWLEETPHPNISIGKKCSVVPIEVVIRGYLTGHAWRTYKSGLRTLCGVSLPEGMKEHQKFPHPILTPATKAVEGHDEDISEKDLLAQGIVKAQTWEKIRAIAFKLFERGTEKAAENGLILVDTKYEFGIDSSGEVVLIDEVHTPDSSRYFYKESYQELFDANKPQKQLSKEFVREWLISEGFMGQDGQSVPEMTDEVVQHIFGRYAELYQKLMGEAFTPTPTPNFDATLSSVLSSYIY
jgi:phosphoribosylaminoimidazole-succinocarboxamide synthase